MLCPECKHGYIEQSDGTSVCTSCGYVFGESEIVNDVTFGETSTGAATVHGTQVSGATGKHSISGPGGRKYGDGDSRALTVHQAQQAIRNILGRLGVDSPALTQTASRIFTLALNIGQGHTSFWNEHTGEADKGGNLVQGRKSEYTYGACIYVACRRLNQPIMLIEIADQINVNVFVLGRAYLRLAQLLRYDPEQKSISLMDPSLYIRRFAKLLDFGDETERVIEDASRLCTRFKKDWLSAGRRPSGITGACLLIAARMNNFRRSVAEIVQVVKVADVTLKRRLDEFKALPASAMSIEDFRENFDKEFDGLLPPSRPPPKAPAGAEGEKAVNGKRKRASNDEAASDDSDDEQESEVESSTRRSAAGSSPLSEEEEDDQEASKAADTPAAEEEVSPEERARREEMEEEVDHLLTEEVEGFLGSNQLKGDLERVTKEQQEKERRAQLTHQERLAQQAKSASGSSPSTPLANGGKRAAASKRARLDGNSQDNGTPRNSKKGKRRAAVVEEGGDPFAGLDEDELNSYLLTKEEAEVKERVWTEFNKQWLEESLQKAIKEEEDLKNGVTHRKNKPRKKNVVRDSSNATGTSAVDATAKMLKTKKLSKKINYAALGNLFPGQNNDEFGGEVADREGSSRRALSEEGDGVGAAINMIGRAASQARSDMSAGAGGESDYVSESESQFSSNRRLGTVGKHGDQTDAAQSEGWDDAYDD